MLLDDHLWTHRSALLASIHEKMADEGLDLFLVTDLSTIRWLTGFSGSNARLLLGRGRPVLFTDFRYQEQICQETSGIAAAILRESLGARLAADYVRTDDRMALQADQVTWHEMQQLSAHIGNRDFIPVTGFFDSFRQMKHLAELDRMKRAVTLSETVLSEVLELIRPGVTEIDIAAEISYRHRKLGAEKDSFDPIVAGGARSAMPHASPTTATLESGMLIVIDMGCIVGGYASDQTRTVALGTISAESRKVYETVRRAQQLGIDAARAGMAARDLDAEVRNYIASEGYGDAFGHGLGHGVGVEVHEPPRIGMSSTDTLQEGSVFTIEPGIYLEGRFGVRIEDMVVLGHEGAVPFQTFTKELVEL